MTLTESYPKSLVEVGFPPKQAKILNGGDEDATNVPFLDTDNTYTGDNAFADITVDSINSIDTDNIALLDADNTFTGANTFPTIDISSLTFQDYSPTVNGLGITIVQSPPAYTLSYAKYATLDNLVFIWFRFQGINWSAGGGSSEGYSASLPISSLGTGGFLIATTYISGNGASPLVGYSYTQGTTGINTIYFDRRAFAASGSTGIYQGTAIYRSA